MRDDREEEEGGGVEDTIPLLLSFIRHSFTAAITPLRFSSMVRM